MYMRMYMLHVLHGHVQYRIDMVHGVRVERKNTCHPI